MKPTSHSACNCTAIASARSLLDQVPTTLAAINSLERTKLSGAGYGPPATDADRAVWLARNSRQLLAQFYETETPSLHSLSGRLWEWYRFSEDMDHLNDAIHYAEKALEVAPTGYINRPALVNTLANCPHSRFLRSRRPEELNNASDMIRAALTSMPLSASDQEALRMTLSTVLRSRSELRGETALEDLDNAIKVIKSLVDTQQDTLQKKRKL